MTATDTEYADAVVVDDESELQRAIDEATLDGTKPTEMVHIESRSGKGFLTIDPQQTEWTETQLVGLKSIGIQTEGPDAVPLPHVLQFLYICQMKDLDPWLREAYLIVHGKIWFKDNGERVDSRKFTLVTGIDGFRKRSEDTGLYLGQVGPEWCGEDGVWKDFWIPKWGHPEMARVGILRKGSPLPTWGVAAYDEYVPMVDEYSGTGRRREKTGRKVPTEMWQKMPTNQTAKCFDNETEVLTDHGFKLFSEVEPGDLIMQVTERGLETTLVSPFVQSYDGPMVTFDSDDLNFKVTPNHDMVTTYGKVEAGAMYATSGAPNRTAGWRIPRLVAGTGQDAPVDDDLLVLAAAVMADGYRRGDTWHIKVSRQAKIDRLTSLNLHESRTLHRTRGTEALGRSGRIVRTNFDQVGFDYQAHLLDKVLDDEKDLRPVISGFLSARQARLVVDALVEFDGSTNKKTGVRRFYTSNPSHRALFDVLAVKAGYAISGWTARISDLSVRPNWYATISDRDAIPVYRWGRDRGALSKGNAAGRTSLSMEPNASGEVWCVTVPSGVIVVRRNGFSMLCGNCAEAQAHRKAFPRQMSGLLEPAEMERAAVEYQQAHEDERQRELAARRHEARARSLGSAPASGSVVEGEVVPNSARAGEPVPVGQAARETVDRLRAETRAPRGESRAPASALGNADARAEMSDEQRAGHLRAEIERLAELFGRTPGQLLARQAAALDKEPKEFTVAELLSAVQPLRAAGADRLRATGRGAEAAAYETVPSGAVLPLDLLFGMATEEDAPKVDHSQKHAYVDAGGVCAVEDCDRFDDDPIHQV